MYREIMTWLLFKLNIEYDYFVSFIVLDRETGIIEGYGNGSMRIRGGATADEMGNVCDALSKKEGIPRIKLHITSLNRL